MTSFYELDRSITLEQIQTLAAFAAANGRTWKSALRQAWETGNYQGFEPAGVLQQIRNTFGPGWLVHFRLPQVTTRS